MKVTLKIVLRAMGDVLFPRKCCVCGRSLTLCEDSICMPCLVNMPSTLFETVSRNPMADKLNALLSDDATSYVYASALFLYRGEYQSITPSVKYFRNFDNGIYFSRMLGRKLASSEYFRDVDYILPVPLHWTRKWKRGYNQAEIIARAIGESFPGAVVDCNALVRVRRTRSQAQIVREGKGSNVAGAFKFVASCEATAGHILARAHFWQKSVAGNVHHILLVDDVFTTGNTLAACWRAVADGITEEGLRISVATLAYAGGSV